MMWIDAKIGYDSRFPVAYAVTVASFQDCDDVGIPITPIVLHDLIGHGRYKRPMSKKNGQMFDNISEAPMSTEFAISRFFIPYLSQFEGWTLFCDSDFLFRSDLSHLKQFIDDQYAVLCVKHEYAPPEGVKMDGQLQTLYKRKNWSSFMLFNNAHPKNKILMPTYLNARPGRDLHAFSWLEDSDIGELPECWNWLEGHSSNQIIPKAVHYTRGTPDMEGYKDTRCAFEWNAYAKKLGFEVET